MVNSISVSCPGMAARRRTALMYGRPSAGRPSRISASAAIRYVSANRATKKSREPRVSLIEDLNGSLNLFKDGNMLSKYGAPFAGTTYAPGVKTLYGLVRASTVSASVVETYTAVSPSANFGWPFASFGIFAALLAYHARVNWAS